MHCKLHQADLRVLIMYPARLSKIDDLSHLFDKTHSFPNAEKFSSGELTLRTHTCVSEKDFDKMRAILSSLE